ncbi:pro-sigmaK processing inhibitor BofA family protein [Herbivorax sp. ANBcel31]|uniref:pro-sigmaK processing inhibitor BofA family protein n=1 Tax=Herbivorax sp. ANBcel31 TaxID=3069754 RepID=UPI0027B0EDA6|nr:pro-sigmaK processing inhibitor BofA family protein [Herbivorax sp. ANBcel31]MDQ2086033.1 pro-sigmaK processing inhibitor BofA family protein [Herbivorax sp. ANBcel31]
MYNDYNIIVAYVIGIIILFLLGKFFSFPMKIAAKLIFNSILGGIIILIINFVGKFLNFSIALNPFTAFIVGTLGVPGVLLIVILKYVFNV